MVICGNLCYKWEIIQLLCWYVFWFCNSRLLNALVEMCAAWMKGFFSPSDVSSLPKWDMIHFYVKQGSSYRNILIYTAHLTEKGFMKIPDSNSDELNIWRGKAWTSVESILLHNTLFYFLYKCCVETEELISCVCCMP